NAALVFLACSEEGRVRAAVSHRHAEPLGVADDDVRTPLAGWYKQGQREQVAGDSDADALGLQIIDAGLMVTDMSGGIRVLEQRAEVILAAFPCVDVARHAVDTDRFGARLEHGKRLWEDALINEEMIGMPFRSL